MRQARPRLAALLLTYLAAHAASQAGPIPIDTDWGQFTFTQPFARARGCNPPDAQGIGCRASFAANSFELDAPPWTFLASAPVTLEVTDAFLGGEVFEVFDRGVSIGSTGIPSTVAASCGDNPTFCFGRNDISWGSFALGPGSHAIEIEALRTPLGPGSGYLRVATVSLALTPVSEPAAGALFVAGAATLLLGLRAGARHASGKRQAHRVRRAALMHALRVGPA